jgi:nucleotide-binding universal stress UspA family protein
MKTILAPVDFSAATDAVVAYAVTLARVFQGRVVLLNVVQAPVMVGDYAPVLENVAKVIAYSEKAAAKRLAKLKARLEAETIPVETLVISDAPITAIADAAKKQSADYIVMGSHGHGAFYELIVGSTTHGVLKHSPCPVVVIPATKSRPTKRKR